MTANVVVEGERADDVLAVPVEAVFRRDDGEIVYVKKPKPQEGETRARARRSLPPARPGTERRRPQPRTRATPGRSIFEERTVETGLSSISHTQILDGPVEGDEVALEDPTQPKKKENER